MNIFIHHRDLRIKDNTTLIEMSKNEKNIIPIFIFPPEQIDENKNKYFSHNCVQFMIESLKELKKDYKKHSSNLYFFKDNNISVIKNIHKKFNINSIGFNSDYSPYAKKRDNEIIKFAQKNKIKIYTNEDILLHNINSGNGLNKDNEPYKVFTPFKKNLMKYKVKEIDNYNKFNLGLEKKLKKIKSYFKDLDSLYKKNNNLLVKGGRKWALKRIKEIKNYNNYDKCRDFLGYETTLLSASINFNVISIRELYYLIKKTFGLNHGLINELYWRDFYYNILFHFPHVIKSNFKENYDKIIWRKSNKDLKAWKDGKTGFPIVDACMRQMNIHGYMHNRGRMIVSSFLVKNLWIDWREGERYFANMLVDYNISANNGGWGWASGSGTDSQPYFRIFNAWTQAKKFDKDCKFIKKYIPELKDVKPEHILKWDDDKIRKLYNVNYPNPIVDHKESRLRALELYKKYL